MNKNLNEPMMGIAHESATDALQLRMMGAGSRDKVTDQIIANAKDNGMLDYENRGLYDQWFNKMMY